MSINAARAGTARYDFSGALAVTPHAVHPGETLGHPPIEAVEAGFAAWDGALQDRHVPSISGELPES